MLRKYIITILIMLSFTNISFGQDIQKINYSSDSQYCAYSIMLIGGMGCVGALIGLTAFNVKNSSDPDHLDYDTGEVGNYAGQGFLIGAGLGIVLILLASNNNYNSVFTFQNNKIDVNIPKVYYEPQNGQITVPLVSYKFN